MDSIKSKLKKFISGSHEHHDLSYRHYFKKGEFTEFSITSQVNDEYFYVESVNGERSVRGGYKFSDMAEEATIVVDVLEIRDAHCVLMFRALDGLKIKVSVASDEDRKVSTCLL